MSLSIFVAALPRWALRHLRGEISAWILGGGVATLCLGGKIMTLLLCQNGLE
jgi:hypothetical protein